MYYSQHNAAAQQHPTYHAPLLKTAVIIQCMHEMEIPMSEHELLAPERHKEPTKQVFVRLVEYCLGINKEELSQPQFSGLQDLAYPELYEDAFFEASLLRESTRLMTICGEPDFGLHDFVTPSSKRLQKHLSAVINLAKYRLESLESYLELNEKREGVLNELNELKIEQDQLRNKLEDAKEVAMQDNGAVQDVYSEISEVEADIAKLNEQNTLIRRQNNELKKKHNFLKDSVDTTSVSIQELKNEEKKLLPQIVQSPQRLKREMSTLESALESERKESSTVEKQVQLVKVAAANVADATKATSTVNEKLEEIKSELDKENMLLPEINITRGNLSKNLNKMTELSNNIDHAKRQHHKYDEKLVLLQKQGNIKKEASKTALEAARDKLLLSEKGKREGKNKIDFYEREGRILETQIEKEAKVAEDEIASMKDEFLKVSEVLMEQNSTLMKEIALVADARK